MPSSARKNPRREDQIQREDQKSQERQQAQSKAEKKRKEARKKDAKAVANDAWTGGHKLETINDLNKVLEAHIADIDHPPDFYRCLKNKDKYDILLSCKVPPASITAATTVSVSPATRDELPMQSEHDDRDPTKQPGSESGSDKTSGLSIDYENDMMDFSIAIWDPGSMNFRPATALKCKNEESFISVRVVQRYDIRTKASTVKLEWRRLGCKKTNSTRFRIVEDAVLTHDVVLGKACNKSERSDNGLSSDSGYEEGVEDEEIEESLRPDSKDEMRGNHDDEEHSSDDASSEDEDEDSQDGEDDAESSESSNESEDVRLTSITTTKRRKSDPIESKTRKENSPERRRHSERQRNPDQELEILAKLNNLCAKERATENNTTHGRSKKKTIDISSNVSDRPRSKTSSASTRSYKSTIRAREDSPVMRDDSLTSRKKLSGRKRPP